MTEFDDQDFEEEEIEHIPRTAQEIARRALVLSAVITVAYGSPPKEVLRWLDAEGLKAEITPYELDFLNGKTSDSARIGFSWKLEALLVLLWCIGKIDKLPALSEQCDTKPMKKVIVLPPDSTKKFISAAQLRDPLEIESEYDKVYQAHWKVRDAQLNNKAIPDKLNPEVVYERHYAFNWVTGYCNQAWEDITTDT